MTGAKLPSWIPRRYFLIPIDVLIFAAAWILAYNFRHDFAIPDDDSITAANNYSLQLKLLLPWIVGSHVILNYLMGLYQGLLRYAGSTELRAIGIVGAIHLGAWALLSSLMPMQSALFDLPQGLLADGNSTYVMRIPYGILVFYALMAAVGAGAVRFSRRLLLEVSAKNEALDSPRTLIVGAGDVADSALRNLSRNAADDFRAVAALAIEQDRVGLRLHGVPVVGTIDQLREVLPKHQIRQVLIALDQPTPEAVRRVVTECEDAGVVFRIVPSMADIADGKVEISPAREIEIEDLLGREAVHLELPEGRNYIQGQVVLITGAGGSIGSELARQSARHGARELILLGKGENSIFEVAQELSTLHPNLPMRSVIADIRDEVRMERVFGEFRPGIVFHAAAHKHVPLMENAVDEAFKNNILGTANVVYLADKYGANRFVVISSDKAVRPSSVMGATKRVAEMVAFAMAERSKCCFQVVRFGNVMGSRGSVIPYFRKQIAAGGPVTVTHADVTRYFMTIPEAVSLVVQAGSRDRNGTLYLLDMGKPVRIADLARNMITLSGYRPGVDIKIQFIGLRPGEKMFEELLTDFEGAQRTEIEKLLQAASNQNTRNWRQIEQDLADMGTAAEEGDQEELIAILADLIPDYRPEKHKVRPRTLQKSPAVPPAPEPLASDPAPIAETAVVASVQPGTETLPGAPPSLEPLIAEPTVATVFDDEQVLTAAPFVPTSIDLFEAPPAPEKTEAVAGTTAELVPENAVATVPVLPPTPQPERSYAALDHALTIALGRRLPVSFRRLDAALDASLRAQLPVPPVAQPIIHEHIGPTESALACPPLPDPQSAGPDTQLPPEHVILTMTSLMPKIQFAEMDKAGSLVVLRVANGFDGETLNLFLKNLNSALLGSSDKVICLGDSDTLAGLTNGELKVLKAEGKAEGQLINEALALHKTAKFLITITTEVLLRKDALEKISEALTGQALLAYSDFQEDKDGGRTDVKLHDHQGCPHERFEFGPLTAYRIAAIEAVGGVRKDLNNAWEYDLHLKLMEQSEFAHIKDFIYTRFVAVVMNEQGKKVFSPGMGPLGGFSYVFYPADVEREVTSVFEDALKRRGAWIDHHTVPVNHGGRTFEVMGSIVIPILNRVKFIANAIEKVQKGTFQNFEIIIIDNGSTDGTIDLVKSIAAKDNRIRLIHGTGGTIASALNEGIKSARGKYICQLDSDDEYAPDCLEMMLGHLETHPNCGLAISYYRLMDENATIITDVAPITHSGYSRNQVLRRDGAGAVRIFPKAVLEEFGYYDEVNYGNFGEDYDMVLKAGEKYDVDRVHKVLYHYRRHSDNTDVTRDPGMKFWNKNHSRLQALKRRMEHNKKHK